MIHLTATNLTDCTVTFYVHGQRYEYFLRERSCLSSIEACAKHSPAKALNLVKRLATKVMKEPTHITHPLRSTLRSASNTPSKKRIPSMPKITIGLSND